MTVICNACVVLCWGLFLNWLTFLGKLRKRIPKVETETLKVANCFKNFPLLPRASPLENFSVSFQQILPSLCDTEQSAQTCLGAHISAMPLPLHGSAAQKTFLNLVVRTGGGNEKALAQDFRRLDRGQLNFVIFKINFTTHYLNQEIFWTQLSSGGLHFTSCESC